MNDDIAKVVFGGPVGAGKTTAIRTLADSEPVSTEMPLSDGAMGDKTTTTVALDFATVALDDGTPLFLYGLPGQDHFAYMRAIVVRGAIGVIVLLDGTDAAVARHAANWVRALREIDESLPLAIGVTHTERLSRFDVTAVRDAIRGLGDRVPIFTVDARDREQTTQLVRALLLCAV